MPGQVRCLPTFILDADQPTTIGLGDTFVGGFLASLAGATVIGRD
jgi:ADP-dependent phosphofructokinase/glucokinase